MLFFLVVTRHLPIGPNVEPDFISRNSFPVRLTYAFFSIQAARPKFYFAWTLGELHSRACVCLKRGIWAATLMDVLLCLCFPPSADAVNNAAGYGFSGMDEKGKPSWDLIRNLNILGIEVRTES